MLYHRHMHFVFNLQFHPEILVKTFFYRMTTIGDEEDDANDDNDDDDDIAITLVGAFEREKVVRSYGAISVKRGNRFDVKK